jgi:putative transposase
MTLFKNKYRIESTRLKGYDYSQPGEYFVTVNTKNHERLFGTVTEEEMRLSPVGEIAKNCWEEIPKHFHKVELDEFVVMPNHVHGIIIINENYAIVDSKYKGGDVACNVSTWKMGWKSPKRGSLGSIIRSYKSAVSKWCHENNFYNFEWQPRFYDHIIRGEKELQNIRDYIINNPIKWFSDKENPDGDK